MHSGQLCDRKKFSFRITEIVVGNHMHFHILNHKLMRSSMG